MQSKDFSSAEGDSGRNVKLTTHPSYTKVKNGLSYISTPPYACMDLCLVKKHGQVFIYRHCAAFKYFRFYSYGFALTEDVVESATLCIAALQVGPVLIYCGFSFFEVLGCWELSHHDSSKEWRSEIGKE
jgi:hypothetical protein